MLTLLIWQVGWVRFEAARQSQADAQSGEYIPLLDSFSEPAVAVAVLKQRLQNLYFTCKLGEGAGRGTRWRHEGAPRIQTGADLKAWKPLALPRLNTAWKTAPDSARQSLSELREGVRSLYGESLQHLLFLQFEDGAWNSFLDNYLELLTLAPARVDLITWGRAALASSRTCGRTDEVLDAVRHFIRFSRDGKAVARFQVMLEDWAAGRIEDRTAFGAPPRKRDSLCVAVTTSAAPAVAKP